MKGAKAVKTQCAKNVIKSCNKIPRNYVMPLWIFFIEASVPKILGSERNISKNVDFSLLLVQFHLQVVLWASDVV